MSDHAHGQGDGGHHDHGGVRKYVIVFIILCILTAISFAVGNSPIMQTPSIGWALMMAVSCCKALLVMGFFMHLIWEANWKFVLTIPATIMSIFLLLMLVPDIGERTRKYSEERWNFAAVPEVDSSHADLGESPEEPHQETGSAPEGAQY